MGGPEGYRKLGRIAAAAAEYVQRRPYLFKFFKGCLPQKLLSPLLNTLPQMFYVGLICFNLGILHSMVTCAMLDLYIYLFRIQAHFLGTFARRRLGFSGKGIIWVLKITFHLWLSSMVSEKDRLSSTQIMATRVIVMLTYSRTLIFQKYIFSFGSMKAL